MTLRIRPTQKSDRVYKKGNDKMRILIYFATLCARHGGRNNVTAKDIALTLRIL